MPIQRIEEVTYGVEDMESCARFFADAGFEKVQDAADCIQYRTAENQIVTLRQADDPSLPPAFEEGSTLRELTWGVSEAADIDLLQAQLGNRCIRDGDTLRMTDPNGLGLAIRVANRKPADPQIRRYNQNTHLERVNDRLEPYGTPPVLRIVHCALNIRKSDNEEALKFYTELLRFKAVDKVLDTGTFLQSEGDIEHHNFFLCFRPDQTGINHIALELYNFDAVMEAGNNMIGKGWKESRRPGRHKLGSNVYRFVHAPCGGRIEFIADMDRMDKDWETRVFEKNPGHHIWSLKTSGTESA